MTMFEDRDIVEETVVTISISTYWPNSSLLAYLSIIWCLKFGNGVLGAEIFIIFLIKLKSNKESVEGKLEGTFLVILLAWAPVMDGSHGNEIAGLVDPECNGELGLAGVLQICGRMMHPTFPIPAKTTKKSFQDFFYRTTSNIHRIKKVLKI